jgi:cyanophycinase-like exopeptidase
VTGRVALHGGGEFLPGDERFLAALLESALEDRDRDGSALSVAIVPLAAARHRPELAARFGQQAFEGIGRATGIDLRVEPVFVIDAASAADPSLARPIEGADVIYLPGGDPDLVATTLAESRVWEAMAAALDRGGTIAGASAGAMALAPRTWTRTGWIDGLGLTPGLVVVPHFADFDRSGWDGTIEELRRDGLGQLGLDERTGVISGRGLTGEWRVAGEGEAHWFPVAGVPVTARDGMSIGLGS